MIFALGEIWLSLLLALLLGAFLGWLLWKWRRRSVSATEWDALNGELAARRRSGADLEREHSALLAGRNAADANQVRLQAQIEDLRARADLVPDLEARLARSEAARSEAARSEAARSEAASTSDPHAQARLAAATATGAAAVTAPVGRLEPSAQQMSDPQLEQRSKQAEQAANQANEQARELAAQLDASTTAVDELEAERQALTADNEERHRRIRQLEEELLSANARAAKAQDETKHVIAQAQLERDGAQAERASASAETQSQALAERQALSREASEAAANAARLESKLAESKKTLDATQADLAARTEQASNLQIELQRRGGELERRVIETNHLNKAHDEALVQSQAIAAERDTALADRDTALADRDTALADRDTALADRDTALAELDGAKVRIDGLTHELDGVTQELDAAQSRVAALTTEVETAHQQSRQQVAEAGEREATLLEQAQDRSAADSAVGIAQQEQIASLEQQVAETQAQANAMRDRLLQANQRAEALGRSQMRLNALEARVAHLSASEAELLQLRSELPDLDRKSQRVDALEAQAADHRRVVGELSANVEAAEQRALRVVELEGKLRASELERDQLRMLADRPAEATGDHLGATSAVQPRDHEGDGSTPATLGAAEEAELRQRAQLVAQLEQRVAALQRELTEVRETADSGNEKTNDKTNEKTNEQTNKVAKKAAKAARQELEELKEALAKSERSLKESRSEMKKLRRSEDASLVELETSLKSLRDNAAQNSATISALRHDLVKARTTKAGHREKRLRSAEEKVAELEASSKKVPKTTTKAKKSKSARPATPDDLKLVSGIGPRLERTLNDLGISRFEQIASMKKADIDKLQQELPRFPGRIVRDDWVGQAKALLESKTLLEKKSPATKKHPKN